MCQAGGAGPKIGKVMEREAVVTGWCGPLTCKAVLPWRGSISQFTQSTIRARGFSVQNQFPDICQLADEKGIQENRDQSGQERECHAQTPCPAVLFSLGWAEDFLPFLTQVKKHYTGDGPGFADLPDTETAM